MLISTFSKISVTGGSLCSGIVLFNMKILIAEEFLNASAMKSSSKISCNQLKKKRQIDFKKLKTKFNVACILRDVRWIID